jgi:hypothetical protein
MAATKLQEQQRAAKTAPAADLHPSQTKISAGKGRYQALTNLSIPQRTDAGVLTGQNDLVLKGETVELTEQEARNLMSTGQRAGRRYPAIRPASEENTELPRIHPRMLSGALRPPVTPAPGTEGPRPDPAGASKILVQEPAIPESQDPMPGTEATGGQETGAVMQDAIDITPGTARV